MTAASKYDFENSCNLISAVDLINHLMIINRKAGGKYEEAFQIVVKTIGQLPRVKLHAFTASAFISGALSSSMPAEEMENLLHRDALKALLPVIQQFSESKITFAPMTNTYECKARFVVATREGVDGE